MSGKSKSNILWIANLAVFVTATDLAKQYIISGWQWLIITGLIIAGYTIGKVMSIKIGASGVEISGQDNGA